MSTTYGGFCNRAVEGGQNRLGQLRALSGQMVVMEATVQRGRGVCASFLYTVKKCVKESWEIEF